MQYPEAFNKIMESVFRAEGGFIAGENIEQPTNFGITLSTMRRLSMDLDGDNDIDIDDVRLMDKAKAKEIYWREYWHENDISKYPEHLWADLFDATVNFGKYGAIRVLQKAINSMYDIDVLKVDGISGKNTIKFAHNSGILADRYKTWRTGRYWRIVRENPEKIKYIHGWIKRTFNI
jgi:lysozyme family protein